MLVFFVAILLVGIGILLYMYWKAHYDRIDRQVLEFSHFPSSFGKISIFFISDVHRRKIKQDTILKIEEKIDLVIIGGDLTEKGVPMQRVQENIKLLKRLNAPIYFVWGNNDYETDYHLLDATLLDCQVKVLANDKVSFESESGEVIDLIGLDCPQNRDVDIETPLQSSNGDFKILAIHDPSLFETFSPHIQKEVDLFLSGHTHGGQIRIFGWGIRDRGGEVHCSHTLGFVSEGYGTSLLPLRLGTKAECHVISLQKKQEPNGG
ncbi:metallophosphoesterase family protein [Bacillaceae bacterium S4-13-56]